VSYFVRHLGAWVAVKTPIPEFRAVACNGILLLWNNAFRNGKAFRKGMMRSQRISVKTYQFALLQEPKRQETNNQNENNPPSLSRLWLAALCSRIVRRSTSCIPAYTAERFVHLQCSRRS